MAGHVQHRRRDLHLAPGHDAGRVDQGRRRADVFCEAQRQEHDPSRDPGQGGARGGAPSMKILVLVKQVPDTATQMKVAADLRKIDTTGVTWIVSPYDEFAIEEALRIKEKRGQGPADEVVAVTLGPDRAKE